MTAYYNEIDPRAAAWLRELIKQGHIAPGDVDERSIRDVGPDDLVGYTQCHFFAGIGGWPYALRLAGWPDDRPVWTGSCPCQPFSTAGKGAGVEDERHLWPELRRLIEHGKPAVCFGEQVAGAAGGAWLAAVRADLEGDGYRVGAADLCAAGIGAPHIRQRLFWVADRDGRGCEQGRELGGLDKVSGGPTVVGMPASERSSYRRLAHDDIDGRDPGSHRAGLATGRDDPHRCGAASRGDVGLADGDSSGWEPRACSATGSAGIVGRDGADERPARPTGVDAWRDHGWVQCSDGRQRPIAPIARRVDDGVPARVGLLRGYGNAIVPQVAAEFIGAWLDVTGAHGGAMEADGPLNLRDDT